MLGLHEPGMARCESERTRMERFVRESSEARGIERKWLRMALRGRQRGAFAVLAVGSVASRSEGSRRPDTVGWGQKEGAGMRRPRRIFAIALRLRRCDGATQQAYSSARNSTPITRGSLTKPVRLLKSMAPISARLLVMLRPYRAISRRP